MADDERRSGILIPVGDYRTRLEQNLYHLTSGDEIYAKTSVASRLALAAERFTR